MRLSLVLISIIFTSFTYGQEDLSGRDAQDFITRDRYTINNGNILFGGFPHPMPSRSGLAVTGRHVLPMRLEQALRSGDEVVITGYSVMGSSRQRSSVYYTMGRVVDGEVVPIMREVPVGGGAVQRQSIYFRAEQLIDAIGADVMAGCDIIPTPDGNFRPNARPAWLGAEARREEVLNQNLQDIAELRDGLIDNIEIPVPALSDAFGGHCTGFIEGENELGPWGRELVNQILNMKEGQGHSDIPSSNYMDLPADFFGGHCPGFALMSAEQKLGFWVHTFAALAYDESTCREGVTNVNGTHDTAEGLLQINAEWDTRRVWNEEKKEWETILGREDRGIGCNALDSDNRDRWLVDYRDNIACGVQIMGNFLCGSIYPGTPRVDVCNSGQRPGDFFDNRYIYWAAPKAGHGREKQRWQMSRMEEYPGCR